MKEGLIFTIKNTLATRQVPRGRVIQIPNRPKPEAFQKLQSKRHVSTTYFVRVSPYSKSPKSEITIISKSEITQVQVRNTN